MAIENQTAEVLEPIVNTEPKELEVPQFTKKEIRKIANEYDERVIEIAFGDTDSPIELELQNNRYYHVTGGGTLKSPQILGEVGATLGSEGVLDELAGIEFSPEERFVGITNSVYFYFSNGILYFFRGEY